MTIVTVNGRRVLIGNNVTAARAQQPMPVVGFLHAGSAAASSSQVIAFHAGLNENGFVDGSNVTVALLLQSLGYPARGIAVALNRAVLPRSAWQTSLSDGARLVVLTAVRVG